MRERTSFVAAYIFGRTSLAHRYAGADVEAWALMKIKPNHLDLPFLPVRQTALDSRVKQMEQIRRKISHQTIENGAEAYAHKSLVNRIKAYLR